MQSHILFLQEEVLSLPRPGRGRHSEGESEVERVAEALEQEKAAQAGYHRR